MPGHSGYTGSYALNAITAPDQYAPSSTIENVPLSRIVLDVVNQSIYWQLKISTTGGQGGVWESAEKVMFPGSRSLTRIGIVGIRIRAATPAGQLPVGVPQAIVTVEAVT